MWLSLALCTLSVILLIAVIRGMQSNLDAHIKRLDKEKQAVEEKYLFNRRRNKELKKQIADMQNALTLMAHDMKPRLDVPEEENAQRDDTRRISDHMVTKGLLTVEQNEKALDKMENLNMDFLGTCLALGYIDLDKARGIVKSLQLHHSPLFAEK
ncbi:hypothetical protein [Pseudodesulfovibrio senegalensis]|jgi:hypothetical protein|uniref:Uncharacterized protein n=1 Tax=Pseudodesulfovibrio senegalensis TaxID=1721087 RepID=A0A6N6N7C8_9BACT|nr:hypothetical protein [Pseudodesulfovibrio senegalensis]KAB1443608.1 hypothetical protein F8A88_05040 [Pseudodesulfovibrio senegalensis]